MGDLEPPYDYIRDELALGRVIPFLGSGASLIGAIEWTSGSDTLPSAGALSNHLANVASYPLTDDERPPELRKAAQFYGLQLGRTALDRGLDDAFTASPDPRPIHKYLAAIEQPMVIFTTNYDDMLERAFAAAGRDFTLVTYSNHPKLGTKLLVRRPGADGFDAERPNTMKLDLSTTVIYKMHGSLIRQPAPDAAVPSEYRSQYVITDDDYVDFLARMVKHKAIPAALNERLSDLPFLFLGYSLEDWNLRVLLARLDEGRRAEGGDVVSWAIQHDPSAFEDKYWTKKNVNLYDQLIDDFVGSLERRDDS